MSLSTSTEVFHLMPVTGQKATRYFQQLKYLIEHIVVLIYQVKNPMTYVTGFEKSHLPRTIINLYKIPILII